MIVNAFGGIRAHYIAISYSTCSSRTSYVIAITSSDRVTLLLVRPGPMDNRSFLPGYPTPSTGTRIGCRSGFLGYSPWVSLVMSCLRRELPQRLQKAGDIKTTKFYQDTVPLIAKPCNWDSFGTNTLLDRGHTAN